MKLPILPFALSVAAMAIVPQGAQAQVKVDMTKVTCADYLAMPRGGADIFEAWMSGWFNQKAGRTVVNLTGFHANVVNVEKWCASNPKESVMAGLDRSMSAAAQAPAGKGGAVTIDAAQITCKQLLEADGDAQMMVASWMGGYFSATKNLSTVDSKYVERNDKVVIGYCKKNPKKSLMEAMTKNWK